MAAVAPSAFAADDVLHHLQVNVPPRAQSVYYSTSGFFAFGSPLSGCNPLRPAGRSGNQWVDGRLDVINGAKVTLITFSSSNCTDGYIARFDRVAPEADGLKNWWVDLT